MQQHFTHSAAPGSRGYAS